MEIKELSVEETALIAKSLGQEVRFKLFKILLGNEGRAIPLQDLSKMIGSSYRNVQVHVQILAKAGLVEIIPKSDPISVRILKNVHFFERNITFVKGGRKLRPEEPKIIAEYLYTPQVSDYAEVIDEETIVKIAKGLGHPTRMSVMNMLSVSPFAYRLAPAYIEKLLRGGQYECSYFEIKQHIDKLVAAGIVYVEKDFLSGKKNAILERFIKIETQDIAK